MQLHSNLTLCRYAYSQIRYLALPIPQALGLFTVLLPVITGITTRGVSSLILSSQENQSQLTLPLLAVMGFQLFYETVIATMSLTNMIPPSSLDCGLEKKWSSLFRAKNSNAIRRIQDNLQCCGLRSTVDKAWPFPDKNHGANACELLRGRTQSCLGPWKQSQQLVAGLFLLVAVSVFALKVRFPSLFLLFIPPSTEKSTADYAKLVSIVMLLTGSSWSQSSSWMRSFKQLTHGDVESAHPDNRALMRGLIEGQGESGDEPERYQDVDGEEQDAGPRVVVSPLNTLANEWRERTETNGEHA
jgi:hypothetical protein